MLLDTRTADRMQAAVDEVFRHLPKAFQTEAIRDELARSVVRSASRRHEDYCEAARSAVLGMFASVDKAIENRNKLATFGAKVAVRKQRAPADKN